MKRALFVLCILTMAAAAAADQATKPGPPPVRSPEAKTQHSPVPVPSAVTSQVYVGETAPDFETWERRCREGYYRTTDHQGAESPSTEHAHGPNAPTDTPDVHP